MKMKKLLLAAGLLSMLIYSCKKEVRMKEDLGKVSKTEETVKGLTCGTDMAMANLSADQRIAMGKTAVTAVQSSELLLFLDFNGAIVRPGNANVTGTFSPLVPNQRFCPPSFMNQEQINAVVRLVEDDFSPFNIRITTDQSVFDNYPQPQNKQIQIITTFP